MMDQLNHAKILLDTTHSARAVEIFCGYLFLGVGITGILIGADYLSNPRIELYKHLEDDSKNCKKENNK